TGTSGSLQPGCRHSAKPCRSLRRQHWARASSPPSAGCWPATSCKSAFGSVEGAARAFGVVGDRHPHLSSPVEGEGKEEGRLVRLGAALFPITQRPERDLVARGKLLLG